MNKLFKRTTAFVLMVCLLCALAVPAVYAAPAEVSDDGSYVYDFLAVNDINSYWWMNGKTKMAFGGTRAFPCSNSVEGSTFEKYYEDGEFNWCYPAIPGTKTGLDTIANATSGAASQWATDSLLFKASTAENIAWFMLKIKAPEVGTYNLSITHKTANNSCARYTKVQIVPAWELPAYEDFDAAAHNAQVDAIVASGNNMLPGVLDCDMNKSVSGEVTDMGNITLSDVSAEDYYVIFSIDLSKSDTTGGVRLYLQSLKLTPATVSVDADTDYYAFGRPEGKVTIDGGVETVAAEYEAGTRNVKIVGYHEEITKIDIDKGGIYAGFTIWNAPSPGVLHQKWLAFQFRAPGTGDYTTTLETYAVTAEKSGSNFHVYLLNADSIVDGNYEAAMTEANLICTSELSVSALNVALGKQTYEAGKEYVLILQPSAKADSATQANNYYLTGLDFVEIPAPAAAIGATEYLTVAEAVAAAKTGDTIKLTADFIGNINVPAGVSIDLNGNTWTVSEYIATNASEYVFDSVGTGALNAGNVELYGDNNGKLPLATADNTYTFADYDLNVDNYEAVGNKTRFWFKLDLADADLDKIAAGNTGLTIGVELAWGEESLVVTFAQGGDEAAFAAAWAAAYKANKNIWLYVDIAGLADLENDLTVKPVLNSADSTLYTGSIVYTVG